MKVYKHDVYKSGKKIRSFWSKAAAKWFIYCLSEVADLEHRDGRRKRVPSYTLKRREVRGYTRHHEVTT